MSWRTSTFHCQSGKKSRPVARLAGDRVLDPGTLQRAVELHAHALEADLGERRVERQRGEIALAGAEVAGRVEAVGRILRIADQDPVLKVVDQVIADVELGEAVAEQRMLDRAAKLPGLLRHQVGIAGIDPVGRTARPS